MRQPSSPSECVRRRCGRRQQQQAGRTDGTDGDSKCSRLGLNPGGLYTSTGQQQEQQRHSRSSSATAAGAAASMYSGTSYGGNPYAVGGSGYRAPVGGVASSSSLSASVGAGSSSNSTGTASSSLASNPYLGFGLGSLAPVAADGVPRSASAASTGSSDGGSSISSKTHNKPNQMK